MSELPIQRISHSQSSLVQRRVFSFLDQELRPNAGFSIRDEFPSLFHDFPGGDSLVIEKNGRVVSHVGIVAREFQHPEFRFKIGLVGSVATVPDQQGQGLATLLLRKATAELKRRGCQLILLWTDNPEFYQPLGFERAGRERDFKFTADQVPDIATPSVVFDSVKHGHLIWRLYLKHEGRLDRSLEEQRRLCKIPKTQIFVTEDKNQVTSYIAINKGADFSNYIHEWGGELQAVRDNIAWVQKHHFKDTSLTLIAPSYYDLAPLRAICVQEWPGVIGMMKVLDRGSLMAVYLGHLKRQGIVADWNREKSLLVVDGKPHPLADDAAYLRLCFGSEESPSLPVLPFFLWGFDSI